MTIPCKALIDFPDGGHEEFFTFLHGLSSAPTKTRAGGVDKDMWVGMPTSSCFYATIRAYSYTLPEVPIRGDFALANNGLTS